MLMILAPSKTQNFSIPPVADATQPSLLRESELLIRELRKFSVHELAVLMKMSKDLAEQTYQRVSDFRLPFTPENARPALMSFKGDVYSSIAVGKYGRKELDYAQDHLRILSGLYGVLRPLDLMQAYRLEMGCKLANSRGRNLYDFWEGQVTAELNQTLAGQRQAVIVNLASMEYSKVINQQNLQGTMLQIDFKERKGDGYRTVAIHAKRARGRMVDFAIGNRLEAVEELKDFALDGYTFRPDLSNENYYLFTRE
ncbi:MAG: peroxide stress protein YaaA [Proteobacteria bacterium]|nr:peroxide stress protein YaaA [Pseudomonadota bacterium]MBU1456840.1 peroxide stress protein YaaA [Pseudomonadota bacterium]